MITKVNILIDGGFFWQRFQNNHKKNPTPNDVIETSKKIMELVQRKTQEDTKDILIRIYYYDCYPFNGKIKMPRDSEDGRKDFQEIDFSKTKGYTRKVKFLDSLKVKERVALRLGELSFTGLKQDIYSGKLKPDFKQKSVDMKFGLDIATMANKHTIDKIVLVAGDSDFIAPIKHARIEGLQVYLYPMGNHIKESLRTHCDYILEDIN